MYRSSDTIVPPASVQSTYAALPTPKRLIVIDDAGHNVFDDICTIHSGSQHLVSILKASAGTPGGFGQLSTLATAAASRRTSTRPRPTRSSSRR
jgi:fermentation-respiration switch protein FrsA (DUF1100 family)